MTRKAGGDCRRIANRFEASVLTGMFTYAHSHSLTYGTSTLLPSNVGVLSKLL